MTKHRTPKNKKIRTLAELDYYRRILWFVIEDNRSDLTTEEKFSILRRVSNEIFDAPLRTAKGRPKIVDTARLAMLESYLKRNPQSSLHSAAVDIAKLNPDPTIAHESLVRRLLSQRDVGEKSYGNRNRRKKEPILPIPIEELEAEGLHQTKMSDAIITDFLGAIEKLLKLV